MNNLQIFDNSEFGKIRTVVIDGEPWFVSGDIAKALGYVKASNMTKLIDGEDKQNIVCSNLEHAQHIVCSNLKHMPKSSHLLGVINESGLYTAIFGSKQENAKRFKKWVTNEVLPSIRKTGSYGTPQLPQTTSDKIALLAQGHVELKAELDTVKTDVTNVIEDLKAFKEDMPILGIEESRITTAVKKRGVACLGGKQSNAYLNRSLRSKLYSDIYEQLKREFGVTSYKAIKRNQADMAVNLIEAYKPPLVILNTIEFENAQQTMSLC